MMIDRIVNVVRPERKVLREEVFERLCRYRQGRL